MSKSLTFKEYEERAMSTCMESSDNFSYMMNNLVGEVGEFAGKVAKLIRKGKMEIKDNQLVFTDNVTYDEACKATEALKLEHGDILWQVFGLGKVVFGKGANEQTAWMNQK